MVKRQSFLLLSLIVAFFLDRYLSTFFSGLTTYRLVFSSYLLLLILIYAVSKATTLWLYPILIVLGIFYDAHYFSNLGLSVWLFPLLLFFLRKSLRYRQGTRWERFLLFLVVLLVFSLGTYGLGLAYGLTTYPLSQLIPYNLLPSLGLNSLYFLIFQPKLERFLP